MTDAEQPKPRVDMDAHLEAEIEAALGDISIDDMMEYGSQPAKKTGGARSGSRGGGDRDRKKGVIVKVYREDVFIEFGPKSQGMCPLSAFDEEPKPGEEREFIIDRFDKGAGLLLVSLPGTVRKAEWESLEEGQVVEARCTGTNKGGLEMEVASHPAFMPAGQVDIRHIDDLGVFVGEKFPCEVMEVDRNRARIILSRRSPLEADRAVAREKLLAQLVVGETVPAVVTTIKEYGAFADLGGMDGLIHISDLSHKRIAHPNEVVKEGDQVNVKILKMDLEMDPPRIGLGLKQTLADPFSTQADEMVEGAIVSGTVTKIMAFGAFVELSPGVEGLIHISELSNERVNRVESVVKEKEVVQVKILSIDKDQRRIGLSLKQAKSEEDGETLERKEDPEMRKLKAQLNLKFGGELKGGLG